VTKVQQEMKPQLVTTSRTFISCWIFVNWDVTLICTVGRSFGTNRTFISCWTFVNKGKSGSLRFSRFSGCWLILSVCIVVSFGFPFVRLFGVR
jgi:hypothetical protein